MQKVTLYIREHKTKRYKPARAKYYVPDSTFVLRYGKKWETLPQGTTLKQAQLAVVHKSLDLQTRKPQPRVEIKTVSGAQTLEVLVDKYLDERAAQRNWRKHTRQAYKLGLGLFLKSLRASGKTMLDEIDGGDLRNFVGFLRKYCTSTGKPYDDRSIWNHFNNVVSFLNAHGKRNLIEQTDWPKYEKKKTVCYDERDMARLLAFADEDEADVIEFYLGVGFRNGEGAHIEWRDIDLRNKEIHVYSKREKFEWEVKDSEQRIVGISDRLAERLKARRKRHSGELVFPNGNGNPDTHLLRIIKRVALRAGLNCGLCEGTINRKRVTCADTFARGLNQRTRRSKRCSAFRAKDESRVSGSTALRANHALSGVVH
jgi:integrase/recombinase XerD